MCPVEKVASCEISFIPLSSNYVDDVKRVLEFIKSSGLEHSVGLLSTTVRGERGRVLNLIRETYEKMDDTCRFIMDVKISNTCGC